MKDGFYSFILRMKYIQRWGLMRNTRPENVSEHSLEVAVLAHALAVLSNTYFNTDYNAEKAATAALFHDTTETITGDMPTPVKYFNKDISNEYNKIEDYAKNKLLEMLPEEISGTYREIYFINETDKELYKLIKAADTLSAYIKCIEERAAGNTEFKKAEKSIKEKLDKIDIPCVKLFMDKFISGFEKSLDEL